MTVVQTSPPLQCAGWDLGMSGSCQGFRCVRDPQRLTRDNAFRLSSTCQLFFCQFPSNNHCLLKLLHLSAFCLPVSVRQLLSSSLPQILHLSAFSLSVFHPTISVHHCLRKILHLSAFLSQLPPNSFCPALSSDYPTHSSTTSL